MGKYNRQFYETNGNVGYQSAREVVPFIIKKLNPRSVIDFGCGSGSWCRAFLECNDSIKIKALDGEWVDKDSMLIPQALFQSVDLKKKVAVDEKYDLAVSLEVAEHIEKEYADVFIHNICSAADIVLFSAAIPLWGGTCHVNEQWPSYWIEKFAQRGYKVLDTIRPYFWNNKNIITCYKQDMFLYIKEERYEEVRANFGNTAHIYDIVHPDGFSEGCSVNKLINRRFLMKHLPENIFLFMKKVYLIFGKDKVV